MMLNMQPILLTSLPRSGSTWVLRVLEQAPKLVGLFEPDHLDINGIGRNGMHPYLKANAEWREYESMYRAAFDGISRPTSYMSKAGATAFARNIMRSSRIDRRRVIVKSVYSLHNTQWLSKRFNSRVVILLRSPYSLIHSIHRKWPEARLGNIISQIDLMDDYLIEYRDAIKRARSAMEILAVHVGAYYRVIQEQALFNPEWIVVKHEDLCSDPVNEFKRLFERLDLTWTQKVENFLTQTNRPKDNDNISHINRISREEVDKGRRLLTAQQMAEIKDYYNVYKGLPYQEV